MRRVLITGSSGFIGGCVHRRMLKLGWDVTGIGRRSIELPGYEQFDLGRSFNESSFAAGQFDVVIHAAARSSPWGSKSVFQRNNVFATKQLLEYCSKANHVPAKFIFVSSPAVYYEPRDQIGINETTPQASKPINNYAASKQQAESLVRMYSGKWLILRPRAVFGPGDTVLFPRILRAAKAGKLPILQAKQPVFGDLLFIDNLVNQIVHSIEHDITGEYNLTNNQPVDLMPFLLRLFERLEIPPPTRRVSIKKAMAVATSIEMLYRLLPGREPPITRYGVQLFAYAKTFNVERMLKTFGEPTVSLEQGVERLVEWIVSEKPYD